MDRYTGGLGGQKRTLPEGRTPRAVGVFLPRSLQAVFWKSTGEMLLSTEELGFHFGNPAASPKEGDT